jgi:hypothetical protein
MMIVVASIAVALIVFIIYALDRKGKEEPIVWPDALKLSLFGGVLTSGVVFASSDAGVVASIPEVAAAVSDTVQDMFVGTPSF